MSLTITKIKLLEEKGHNLSAIEQIRGRKFVTSQVQILLVSLLRGTKMEVLDFITQLYLDFQISLDDLSESIERILNDKNNVDMYETIRCIYDSAILNAIRQSVTGSKKGTLLSDEEDERIMLQTDLSDDYLHIVINGVDSELVYSMRKINNYEELFAVVDKEIKEYEKRNEGKINGI